MAHDPSHHHHGHHHDAAAPAGFGFAFATASALNLGLVAVQIIYGLSAHSVALLADAGHNFGDALGLLLAWLAHRLGRVEPTEHYTYGLRSASILSALCNATILLIATGAIALEAIQRFGRPGPVGGVTVMVVAAVAIVVNGLSAWLLMVGQKDDLNIRSAFAHMLADASVSAGVVIAGGVILLTGLVWIDPAVSLLISLVIVWNTWSLMREAMRMAMDAVPSGISAREVRRYLEKLSGVSSVHDLHIWSMSTTENALTAHLVLPGGHPGDEFLAELCHELDHRFRIRHPTIQIELGDAAPCMLEPATRI